MTESTTPLPPEGWPRAERARRVAFLGWARLSAQAREGSGYNLNASDLAHGLALAGHSVSYLRSGMDFAAMRGPFIRHVERWRGVECFDYYNSANLSPASSNFRNLHAEFSSPRDARVVLGWLDHVGAELVHVHSLEGFALDLIGAIRESGRPVVVTPHNYWYACPQVDLLHRERDVCMDYDGGRRCVGCLEAPDPRRLRLKRAIEQSVFRTLGGFWGGTVRGTYFHLKHHVKRLLRRDEASAGNVESKLRNEIDPDVALGFGDGVVHPAGLIPHRFRLEKGEEPPEIGESPIDQNERFLRAPHHLTVLNDYGRRRIAGIDALNRASAVTPPSQFLLDAMRTMGVRAERLRLVRLGQPHFDRLNRAARSSPYYGVRPWNPTHSSRPLRFGFLGTTRNNKGLEILVKAVPLLPREVRQRAHFLIRAAGWDWPLRKRLAGYPEVSFVGGYDTLQLVPTMAEFDVGILPHIWFENSPLVMLEFLHAGRFIIASRLGGPANWIVEPGQNADAPCGNGLLFPAGDPQALAACIERAVRGDAVIPSAREVHAATPSLMSYPDHVSEVMSLYESVLGGEPTRSRSAPVPTEVPSEGVPA